MIAADQCGDAQLFGGHVLVLQNEVSEAINRTAAAVARRLGLKTILNAAPARPFRTDLPILVDILVVNAIEAEMLGGGAVTSIESAMTAACALLSQFSSVVVTAGGDGAVYADRDGREHLVPPIKVKVASTHGAGDTFVGTLAGDLAAGTAILPALEAASRAAAAIVSTPEADR